MKPLLPPARRSPTALAASGGSARDRRNHLVLDLLVACLALLAAALTARAAAP
jgi:hypothetical protein